ncbi:rho-related GTP-binding protein RhoC-like [Coccinella septempunctata]|uniref:rho-related GTP-binding protein RhoC-like n=1 Tax=Coccinella septempunctata TaxID=41139 RepID=UPI001D0621A0|nr:rho-related GTP-binding protein RhoC-like [Coccinella septempunctata]
MSSQSFPKKLVVVGDGACGKTSLLTAQCNNTFSEMYLPSIYETYLTSVTYESSVISFALWDTAGEEDYDRLRPLSYPRTDVVLMCFNVDNPVSLQNIHHKWYPEIKHFCPSVPILLVATKLDLRYNEQICKILSQKGETTVSHENGYRASKKIKAYGYIECSAKTMEGVKEVFRKAAEVVLRPRKVRRRVCHLL